MNTETLDLPLTTTAGLSLAKDAVEMVPGAIHLKNILVPLDFSEASLKALRYAVPFAAQFGAKITLLHVIEPPVCTPELPCPTPLGPDYEASIENQLQGIRNGKIPSDVASTVSVRHNFVFDGILEEARETCADLIITTTHGRTGLMHLLMGSTAENIVRKAPCPVLVVRERQHDFV